MNNSDCSSDSIGNRSDANIALSETYMPILPITFLIRFIKPYNGSIEDLNTFISECNKAFSLASSTQRLVLLDYVQTQISGKAKAACANRHFKSWDQLRTFLSTVYDDSRSKSLATIAYRLN